MNQARANQCLCDLVSLTQELVNNSTGASIVVRDVCVQVEGQTEPQEAYAVYQVTVDATTLLRYEDVNGNEIAGATPVECDCPCTVDGPVPASCAVFRLDNLDLRSMDGENLWPLRFTGNVNNGNRTVWPIALNIARDPSWTDMSRVYQALADVLNSIPGVESYLVDVTGYNADNGRDVRIAMPLDYTMSITRENNEGYLRDTYTMTVFDTTTRLTARDRDNNTIPSPVWWDCDGSELGSDVKFENNMGTV